MHDGDERGAVALRHARHHWPPALAIVAHRIHESLPHHRLPSLPLPLRHGAVEHEPIVALGNRTVRPAASRSRQQEERSKSHDAVQLPIPCRRCVLADCHLLQPSSRERIVRSLETVQVRFPSAAGEMKIVASSWQHQRHSSSNSS